MASHPGRWVLSVVSGTLLAAFVVTPTAHALGAKDDGFAGWLASFWNTVWWLITVQHWSAIAIALTLTSGLGFAWFLLDCSEEGAALIVAVPATGTSIGSLLWLMISGPPRYGLGDIQTYYAVFGLGGAAFVQALSWWTDMKREQNARHERLIKRIVDARVKEEVERQLKAANGGTVWTGSYSRR
jgi:hypothetical protein